MFRLANASVSAAIEDERKRHASLLADVRCGGLTLFILLFLVFGEMLQRPEWQADWWLLLPYWSFSVAAWWRRGSRWQVRLSGWSVTLVDIPIVYALQYLSLENSTSPGGVAGFTLSLAALLIFLVSLTFHRYDLAGAVVVSNVCEVFLQRAAGLGSGPCVAATMVIWMVGLASHYAGTRVRDLALHVYQSATNNAQMFRQLNDAQNSFRALVDSMHDVVIAYHQGRVIYANKALLKICHCKEIDEVLGRPLTQLLATLPDDDRVDTFETDLLVESQDPIPIEALRTTMNFMGVHSKVIIGRDIAERRMATRQMALNERMVTMGLLAAGVAHEINNPLAAVLGNLDLVRESTRAQRARAQEFLFGDMRENVRATRENISAFTTEHMTRDARHDLLNMLTPMFTAFDLWLEFELPYRDRDLAEISDLVERAMKAATHVASVSQNLKNLAGPQDHKPVPIALQPIIENVLGMSLHVVRGQAQLTTTGAGDTWVQGHGSGLVQVFLNLIINATQAVATTQRKEIEISLIDTHGDSVVVAVRDTGVGMPLDVQMKLFSSFFTTKPAGIGTGIGLSMSKNIIEGMGGRMWFESSTEAGTTFFIELRRAQPIATPSLDNVAPVSPSPPVHRGCVLVVDDNPMVADVVKRALAQDNDVIVCTSPVDALARIKQGHVYDAIVCDVMMPAMTGLQLHGEVAEIDQILGEKIIFLTGSVYEGDMLQELGDLPNPLLLKPFEIAELREAVRRCARHRSIASSAHTS